MEEKLKQMGSARWQQGLLNQWSGKVPMKKFEQRPKGRQGASHAVSREEHSRQKKQQVQQPETKHGYGP